MAYTDNDKRKQPLELKDSFEEHYKELLEDDYATYIDCNNHYLRRAIRVNTLRAKVKEVEKTLVDAGWTLTPVPWCAEAFWIEGERRDIGNLLEHQLGELYIQDPASMLPPIVLKPEPGDRVLDMCASPGSKTSQASAMMNNTGIIIANDADSKRLVALGTNLQRLGVMNAVHTNHDGRAFRHQALFDKVMVDAPCSGTGTIRRSAKAISMFNIKQVQKLGRLQLQLLEAGYAALVAGGAITYSTCTLEPLENECVVSNFLQAHPEAIVDDIELDIKREEVITTHPDTQEELHPDVKKCLRIHPYTNDTEGFFVCRIRKPR